MKDNSNTNCGIYQIVNLVPNIETGVCKVYIGSSINLKDRKYRHFLHLKEGKHCNKFLQRAYDKIKYEYGENEVKNKFKFETIEYIEKYKDIKELKKIILQREQFYLNTYILEEAIDFTKCYNLLPTAGSNLGTKFSKEFKEKISRSLKKYYKNNTNIKKGIKHTKEEKEKISKGLKRYYKINSHCNKDKFLTEDHKKKIGLKSLGRGFKKVINLETNMIFNSISEASKFYDIHAGSIGEVCKGKRRTAGGYRWKYSD